MGGKKHNYNSWEERTISEVNVEYHLRSCSGNSLLAAVGNENREGRMTYVVAKEYLEAFGSNATINAYTQWRNRHDVVQWLISLVRNDDSLPALSDSYLVPKNKRHGSSIDEEEKPAQGNPIKSFRKKLRSSLVHQKQDTGRSNAINLVPPKEAGPSEPTDSDLVPKNKRHGSSIDEEEKPAQGNPIKSFRKKLRSSLVHPKQDTGRSNAINLVPPKEAGPSEPTDSYLVPKNKRHGSSIDEEEKPAQGNPIKSFRKKLRSSLVHQKQDTGRSNAINLVPPKEAGPSEPTDSDLVPKNKRHGSSIDEEEKPAQGNPIKSFRKKLSNAINLVPPKEAGPSEPTDSDLVPKNKRHGSSIDEEEKPAQGNPIKSFRKKLRSSLVHQKQDTGRSNAINLVPPKEAGPSEPTDSYLVPKNKRHGSSIDEEEKPAQGNPIKSFRKKLRSSLVHQKQDTGRSNAINLVPPKEAGPSEPTDSDLVPKNKRHGSSIDEEEKPAQGNPIKSFRKKLRSSLVHQKQDTGRSNAINLVPPKEAGPSEPTDSYLVPRHKRHGSSIDEEEKPAQGNPIKSFRKKLRSSLVHQKQDTGRSNAINLVPPKDAAASEPTDSDLVPKNKRHGSSIDEEEKPAQRYPIKSFPKKLRSSLVHQKQDTGRSNAINLVPPKEAAASEPTGRFTPREYSNRVEIFCGISMRTFRDLCTLVKEPLSNSPRYKFNDNRELTVDAKVAIAMRRLKLGKSLNSIGDETGMHSFTADKVTRSFVEAVNGLSHLHGPGAATEGGTSAETLDSAVEEGMSVEKLDRLKEEWKVLTTGMKPEKLRCMIKACCILHNIVTDMND
ncbi:uncharacterized protein LOC108202719 isoform X1 [Daucus carota subsp. sativus]|uniref:uncharacterized protein LOC108202719 isoform X1 n=1 Tax=Daucus carota subsp. sativus TaxID=79200 RepID=UPI00308293D9